METIKHLITKHGDKFKFLLLGGIGIAAFNTIVRADYNLVLYLYIYYVWNMMIEYKESQISEKTNIFFVLLYSLGIDIIWCIYWNGKWNMIKDEEGTIHSIVLFLSWIGILLKLVISIFIGFTEWINIQSSLPDKLKEKLNSVQRYQSQMDEVAQ